MGEDGFRVTVRPYVSQRNSLVPMLHLPPWTCWATHSPTSPIVAVASTISTITHQEIAAEELLQCNKINWENTKAVDKAHLSSTQGRQPPPWRPQAHQPSTPFPSLPMPSPSSESSLSPRSYEPTIKKLIGISDQSNKIQEVRSKYVEKKKIRILIHALMGKTMPDWRTTDEPDPARTWSLMGVEQRKATAWGARESASRRWWAAACWRRRRRPVRRRGPPTGSGRPL